MKNSLKNIGEKGKNVEKLFDYSKLTKPQEMRTHLIALYRYLQEVNVILHHKPITVASWKASVAKKYLIPALSQFLYLRECLAIYEQFAFQRPVCPRAFLMELAIPRAVWLTQDMVLHSFCTAPGFTMQKFDVFLEDYTVSDDFFANALAQHPFQQLPQAVRILGFYGCMTKLEVAYDTLLKVHNRHRVVVPRLEWNSTKTQLVQLVYLLKANKLVQSNKNTLQEVFTSLSLLFGLSDRHLYKLWQDALGGQEACCDILALFTDIVTEPIARICN